MVYLTRVRIWAIVFALCIVSCVPLRSDTLVAQKETSAATRKLIEAIDSADAYVQPLCGTLACLSDWRARRDALVKSVDELHAISKRNAKATVRQ